MSTHCSLRISPPLRLLTTPQQTALDVLGRELLKDYKPHGARAYQRWIKLFLYLSGLFKERFDPEDQQPITPDHWAAFDHALAEKGIPSPATRRYQVICALRACFPHQQLPSAQAKPVHNPTGAKAARLSWARNKLPNEQDKAFVLYLESTDRPHRADDYRRFLGLINRACPGLLDLPPEQRFLASNLSSHLDKALARLKSFEQFQRLHLIAEGLNDHFASQDYTWLRNAILQNKNRLALRRKKGVAKPSRRKTGFSAKDLRHEPFLSVLDRAIPTLATPKSRIGNVRPIRPGSRRLYELDLAHLLSARLEGKIGTPQDDVEAWFSKPSIRVLEKILPFQVSYRTAGKILVRLRRLYWRIFGTSQTLEYEYMSMVGRRFFKAGSPAWKRMDHIDAKALLAAIKERIAYFGTRLDEAGGIAAPHEIVTYRNLLVFALALSTGLRLGNVTRLQRDELLLEGSLPMVSIPPNRVKNKIALHLVLEMWLATHISRYLNLPSVRKVASDSVWLSRDGAPLSVDAVYRSIKDWSRLVLDETLTPHDLRRLFSSNLLRQGGMTLEQVAKANGHKNVNTTATAYGTNVRPEFQSIFDEYPLEAAA